MVSLGFGMNKSRNVSSGATAGYDLQESINQSGSEQGSQADSFGLNVSQSGQNIFGGQQPFLTDIYGQAQNLYQNNQLPNYQVAGMNPALTQGLNAQTGFATGAGNDIYTAQLQSALGNLGQLDAAGNVAGRMAGGSAFSAPTVGNAGYTSELARMGGQAQAQMANDPNLSFANRLAGNAAMSGGAQSNIDLGLAGSIANNPYLNSQIDAASRDVVRNLQEGDMVGNASAAAASGNSGSSRRAVMDAVSQRGAADRVADISAAMRGQAYQQGVGTAAQQAAQNANLSQANQQFNTGQFNQLLSQGATTEQAMGMMNAQLGTQASQFNTGQFNNLLGQGAGFSQQQALNNAGLQGQNQALNANLMGQGADLNFRLGQAGTAGLGNAFSMGNANAGAQRDAGNFMRQYQQQLLDAQYKNEMNPYNSLEMYRSFIGAPTVLSSSNSLGLQGSNSNSFGNSFSDSYNYGMGANMGSNSGTGSSSGFNASFGTGK